MAKAKKSYQTKNVTSWRPTKIKKNPKESKTKGK